MYDPSQLALFERGQTGADEDTLHQMRTWPASFIILTVSIGVLVAAAYWWLHKVYGWKRIDAVLAVLPGALSFVVAVAEDLKADLKKIAITQSIRLFAMIEAIPLLALAITGAASVLLAASKVAPMVSFMGSANLKDIRFVHTAPDRVTAGATVSVIAELVVNWLKLNCRLLPARSRMVLL